MSNHDYCTNKILQLNKTTEEKAEMLNTLLDVKFYLDKYKKD